MHHAQHVRAQHGRTSRSCIVAPPSPALASGAAGSMNQLTPGPRSGAGACAPAMENASWVCMLQSPYQGLANPIYAESQQ